MEASKIKYLRFIIAVFAFSVVVSCVYIKEDKGVIPNAYIPLSVEGETGVINSEVPVSETSATNGQSSTEEASTLVILNPPHGEPGHSCDIPVGSPLNSAPLNTSVVQSSSNTAPVEVTPVSGSSVVSSIQNTEVVKSSSRQSFFSLVPTVNPPHGNLGHRCDLPVGAPLTPTKSSDIVLLNPAHGMAGHRCDIPVGDPLPSS